MNLKSSENIYDKLFDFSKINALKSSSLSSSNQSQYQHIQVYHNNNNKKERVINNNNKNQLAFYQHNEMIDSYNSIIIGGPTISSSTYKSKSIQNVNKNSRIISKQQQLSSNLTFIKTNQIQKQNNISSFCSSSSTSSSLCSLNQNPITEFQPGNLNSNHRSTLIKTKLPRSKSLNIKKSYNICILNDNSNNFIQNNQNSTVIYDDTSDFIKNKPKIHPRSIYLTYEENSEINQNNYPIDVNNTQDSSLEIKTNDCKIDNVNFVKIEQETTTENRSDLNMSNLSIDQNGDLTINSINKMNKINNLDQSTQQSPNMGKNQFRSFINKKILNKTNSNSLTTTCIPNLDETRSSGFRNKIFNEFMKPISLFSSKKSTSSNSSSKSSSFSSSVSCSSSSSSPSSPTNISRKFKSSNQNEQTINPKDYESIYDDETEKKFISKGKIVDELIQTEMDFYKVMKLLYDVFLGPNSDRSIQGELKEAIFCNIKDIVDLSSKLLNDFESNILNQCLDQVKIGKCFLKNCDMIRITYSNYAQYIEYSNNVLEKNEKVPEIHQFIENGLNIIKQQMNIFDLHSLLLKPIQRVLKYPLLLQELIKNTESYHEDYQDLLEALKSMQDVATYINEIKRRHELIVKYGRKLRDNSTISNKMSKFTMHSMIKKSNRISVKLSSALKLNSVTTIDEKFDSLEAQFHFVEKMIKCFIKDSFQSLSSLKEFLKSQTIAAESLQEYYSENGNSNITKYVQINSLILNDFITKRTNIVHEKVIKPLKSLLEYLEIPNKLIIKRHDKLLDYEFARLNMEKMKDKYSIKTHQDNLNESRKNFEALNNQLIEELPNLIKKCSIVFEKCFEIFIISLKNIYKSIRDEIYCLINMNKNGETLIQEPNENSTKVHTSFVSSLNKKLQNFTHNQYNNNNFQLNSTNLEPPNTNNNNNNITNSNYNNSNNLNQNINNNSDTNNDNNCQNNSNISPIMPRFSFSPKNEKPRRIKTLFTNSLQIFKNLTNSEKHVSHQNNNNSNNNQKINSASKEFQDQVYNSPYEDRQTDEIRARLRRVYQNDLFIVAEKYSGYGLNGNLNLEVDDLVYALKKSDPLGNPDTWFIDNGITKGMVPSKIFKLINSKERGSINLIDFDEVNDCKIAKNLPEPEMNLSKLQLESPVMHSYENNSNDDTDSFDNSQKPVEYCVVLYSFEAISDSTLSITEGEELRVLQKHDTNMNSEWWLVEKVGSNTTGYVPANYIKLI